MVFRHRLWIHWRRSLAAITRLRFIQYARFAVDAIRARERERAMFYLGVASGQVLMLYDINYSGSYALQTMIDRIERLTSF